MIRKNQKGFTLMEVLVVVAIISILFIALLPFVNNAVVKANETGVKTNFHDFQLASEMLLREANGKGLDKDRLNLYLDKAHELKFTDSSVITSSKDAWGNPYRVEFGDRKIMFYSNGKSQKNTEKAYVLVSYYYKGKVSSCTTGFMSNNLILSLLGISKNFVCGENLPDSDDGPTSPETDGLTAPTNFIASNVTNSSTKLSWNRVSGATQYVLKRNGVTIYIGSGNNFSDVGLSPNVTYTYEAAARNALTISSYSSIQVKTLAGPNAPTNFRADNITTSNIDLSWNASSGATTYILYRNGTMIYTGVTPSYQETGLTPYTSYNYSLVAANASGTSETVNLTVKTLASYETVKLPDLGTGNCSPYNPYIITTLGELQGIYLDLDACYELGNDINAVTTAGWNGGEGFAPIHVNYEVFFTGKLDGKNHGIHDLFINRIGRAWVGLFDEIEGQGVVKNIRFENANITGLDYVGALAGYTHSNSIIENVSVSGEVIGRNLVGGLVGELRGSATTVTSSANVTGQNAVGGLIGTNKESFLTNAYATGNVSGEYYVGGLVGSTEYDSEITNSNATGNVSGNEDVGGLVGLSYSYSKITNSNATGNVSGNEDVGGLVGLSYSYSKITNSHATGDVTGGLSGGQNTGGLVGYSYLNSSITNSHATGNVTGDSDVGGLVGENSENSTITDSFAEGSISGYGWLDGLVGYNYEGKVINSHATGTVTGEIHLGGLVGESEVGSSIEGSYASNTVTGEVNIGGLVGHTRDESKITNSYATGDASGDYYVGGLVGSTEYDSEITNSHATGNVTGDEDVGGLVGLSYSYSKIANSNATGDVSGGLSGGENTGGLVGALVEYSMILNSNSTSNVTGSEDVGGLVGESSVASTITDSYAEGTVSADGWVGGLVGYNDESTVSNSYAMGSVTGENNVGGLAGSSEDVSLIEDSYATGNVSGTENVGGLAGVNFKSTIKRSYSSGSVNGTRYVGGFVGANHSSATIENSYTTSVVTGGNRVGGFAGENTTDATIQTSYANGSLTGSTQTGGFIGNYTTPATNSYANTTTYGNARGANEATTAQMKQQSTFTGWDFSTVWAINTNTNNGFPYLR